MKDTLLSDGGEDAVSVETKPVHQKWVNVSESPRDTVNLKSRNND